MDNATKKRLFIETKKLNTGMSISLMSEFLGTSKKNIEAYLYDSSRSPSMWSMFLLKEFCRRSYANVPIELTRNINRELNSVIRLAKKNKMGNGEWQQVGYRLQRNKSKYIYKGELLLVSEIGEITSMSLTTIYARIKKHTANPNDDITEFLYFKQKKRAVKSN